jgi:hypothetical protein
VHRVQTSELHDDEEQEDHDREAGAEEVLPARSEADRAPGNEMRGAPLAARTLILSGVAAKDPTTRELNEKAMLSQQFAAIVGQ